MKRAAEVLRVGHAGRQPRLVWEGMDAKPATTRGRLELVTRGADTVRLIQGDNAMVLAALKGSLPESVALAYLDPPFLTGRMHQRVTRSREPSGKWLRSRSPAFDDRWSDIGAYLTSLRERLIGVRDLLTPSGCVVVHVDPRTSHYVKLLCDELFGEEAFASEIVWRYRRWPSKTPNFQRVHDVLLRYVKDPRRAPSFVQLFEPLAPSTTAVWGRGKQRAVVGEDGRRTRSTATSEPSPGVPMGDVWDIGIIAPVAKERTGYPTQKPEALLERLIASCTHPGDTVLDPYAGSGTTLAVAARLGRRAIGIDESAVAIQVCEGRLRAAAIEATRERCVPA